MGNNIGKLDINIPKELEVKVISFDTHKELILKTTNGQIWALSFPKYFNLLIQNDQDSVFINISPTILLSKESRALWGTLHSFIRNAVIGLTQGFTRKLVLKGVGYRFEPTAKKNTFVLYIGLTHPKLITIPDSIECTLEQNNTVLDGKCQDLQTLTNELNKIRLIKPAIKDKYSGKGFYITGE